jgi:hypothetical protein
MRELENHPVYKMSLASVYRHYVTKVEKKGRTRAELDEAVCWLTGFDAWPRTSRPAPASRTSSPRPA